jgi:putative endonuclease
LDFCIIIWVRSPEAAKPFGIPYPRSAGHRDSINMKPCVYILLLNKSDYYVGSTTDIERRLSEHKLGNHAGTRYCHNIELVFTQEYDDYPSARKIESRLKKFKNKKILERIVRDGKIKLILGP